MMLEVDGVDFGDLQSAQQQDLDMLRMAQQLDSFLNKLSKRGYREYMLHDGILYKWHCKNMGMWKKLPYIPLSWRPKILEMAHCSPEA